MPFQLQDLEYGALAAHKPVRVTAGTTTQLSQRESVLHRILVGGAPAADRTITLRNGSQDTDPIVAVILVAAAPQQVSIPVGLAFSTAMRAIFSGAVDVTFLLTE